MTDKLHMAATLPIDHDRALLVGRAWLPGRDGGPTPVLLRDGQLVDIGEQVPTVSALLERDDLATALRAMRGAPLGALQDWLDSTAEHGASPLHRHLLAPNDLQVVKAAGVTFAQSMVERVIEEQTRGDAALRRGRAGPGGRHRRRRSCHAAARIGAGGGAQAGADRAPPVVAVPGGRNRTGCRDLHQGSAAVVARHRRADRHPSGIDLEQPGARGGAGGESARRRGRRGARQRCQPARFRRPQCVAARQGQGQQRRPARSARSSGCSTRTSASTTCARPRSR